MYGSIYSCLIHNKDSFTYQTSCPGDWFWAQDRSFNTELAKLQAINLICSETADAIIHCVLLLSGSRQNVRSIP